MLDRVVALVNDGLVLDSELEAQTREITARLRGQNVALPGTMSCARSARPLVLEEIQAQHADRRHQGVGRAGQRRNGRYRQRQGITLEQLPAKLAADGIDYASTAPS